MIRDRIREKVAFFLKTVREIRDEQSWGGGLFIFVLMLLMVAICLTFIALVIIYLPKISAIIAVTMLVIILVYDRI